MAKKTNKINSLPILILNGPNLNLLGTREPGIYGRTTLKQIEQACRERAKAHGFSIEFAQSNKEGKLVDMIQAARKHASALILNAAAYTHTSVAVLDALKMLSIPVIEVHLSNPGRREEFRHTSFVAKGATGTIAGFGLNSYLLALDALADILKGAKNERQGRQEKIRD